MRERVLVLRGELRHRLAPAVDFEDRVVVKATAAPRLLKDPAEAFATRHHYDTIMRRKRGDAHEARPSRLCRHAAQGLKQLCVALPWSESPAPEPGGARSRGASEAFDLESGVIGQGEATRAVRRRTRLGDGVGL